MGGGLLQLVAYGAQDVYLTGNPQITFWKVVYRRHTNFALEAIEQSFNGTAGYGRRITCQISRNGDLIHRMYLAVTLQTATDVTYVNNVGLAILKNVEIEIGGQKIDKHYAEWMLIWNELSMPVGKRNGYDVMIGKTGVASTNGTSMFLYVPLEFWFCRTVGLALPLIALQYHDVKINIEFDSKTAAATATGGATIPEISDVRLWVDYVYLDTDERRRMAQMSHEYLITQLQFTGAESVSAGKLNAVKLNLNHPVIELVWVGQKATSTKLDFASALGWNNGSFFSKAKLLLNGQDRFAERDGNYFSLIQPFQHHENVPVDKGISVYSFALKPEEHQPSGTLNFSRIDTAVLQLYGEDSVTSVQVYAVNYNVLRIMSGMAGVAFSS
jgi:hypothetical protein